MSAPVWVINLDAEDELAGDRSTPSKARAAQMARAAARFRAALPVGHIALGASEDAHEREGRAFCPTPGALARLRAAGAVIPPSPDVDVLRRVNARRFANGLAPRLPGTTTVESIDGLEHALRERGPFRLKRDLTSAGRGQRRVEGGGIGDEERAWARRALAAGPLHVEPFVRVIRETSLHGLVPRSGTSTLRLGRPVSQTLSKQGAFLEARPAPANWLEPSEDWALHAATERVAIALSEAGYFGPFGVDAFRYEGEHGIAFLALSEINARFTMAWSASGLPFTHEA